MKIKFTNGGRRQSFNPVAKYAHEFNRSERHRDKKHDYHRRERNQRDSYKNTDAWQ